MTFSLRLINLVPATRARATASTPISTLSLRSQLRTFTSSSSLRASAGYGDPQDEKIENSTPTANDHDGTSTGGSKVGEANNQNKSTDPEVSGQKGNVGNAGGEKGAGNKAEENVTSGEIRETKKIGEEPKDERTAGAGPIGG